jgi:hypothetical protein
MSHLYWAFECKTPGCNGTTAFIYGGIYNPKKIPLFISNPPGVPLTLICKQCKQPHPYDEREIHFAESDEAPSADFPRMPGV